MGVCVQQVLTSAGVVVQPMAPQPANIADCGMYIQSGAEATLAALFVVPEPGTLQAAFSFGLSAPLTLYLVAYCVGLLVHFFDKGD